MFLVSKASKRELNRIATSLKRTLNNFDTSTGYTYSTETFTTLDNERYQSDSKPPGSTKVVICGGGLIGTSVAYHLADLGYKDVVLLTRDKYALFFNIFWLFFYSQ